MRKIAWIFLVAALLGCGVKGKPLPPLNPAPIGDGRLSYQKKAAVPQTTRPRTIPVEEEESPDAEEKEKDPR